MRRHGTETPCHTPADPMMSAGPAAERTPLLLGVPTPLPTPHHAPCKPPCGPDALPEEAEEEEEPSLWSLEVELLRQFGPAAGSALLYFVNQTVTTMFVGRDLGATELAYYSVGISVFNVTGLSVCLGLAAALDTLSPQLYGSGCDGHALGTLLHRGTYICCLLAIPVAMFFYFSEPVVAIFFGEQLAPGVANFLWLMVPNLFLQVLANCLHKVLQGQRVPDVPMKAAFVSVIMCPVANLLLTHHGRWGAVAALTVCSVLDCLTTTVLAIRDERVIFTSKYWFIADHSEIWRREKVLEFLRIGLPALGAIIASWWAMEVFIALAAHVGEYQVDAYAVNTSVMLVCFAIPYGMSVASSVGVGNALGGGKWREAKRIASLGVASTAIMGLCNATLLWLFGDLIFGFYTSDKKVLQALSATRWGLVLGHFCDALQTALQGTCRGAGQQAAAARIVTTCLWCCGLPVAVYLTFHEGQGLNGLYTGLIMGLAMETPLLLTGMFRWDWPALADAAIKSSEEETVEEMWSLPPAESA